MNVKSYLISVCSLIVLTEISRLILPSGKTKKTAEVIFSLVIIITLLSPVIGLKDISVTSLNNMEFSTDESFLYRANVNTEELYKTEVESFLRNDEIVFEGVAVICEKSRIKKVRIFLSGKVIEEENGHINISEVTTRLASLLNIEREAIEIVER